MQVEDHSHCTMCSRTIELGDERCGREECEDAYRQAQKEKKRQVYIFVGMLAALMLLSVLLRGGL